MPALGQHIRPAQLTAFSPRLQQAVRLLHLSSLDYAQALQEAAEDNPFLDFEDATPAATDAIEAPEAAGPDPNESRDFIDRLGPAARGAVLSHEESADALQRLPVAASLRQHLHAQLGVLRLGERERMLAAAVVESLDDDGYLRISLDDIAAVVREDGEDAAELDADLFGALRRVQALDPPGVGARSVSECLLLQLPRIADPILRDTVRRIASGHLELLARHHLKRLADALGEPLVRVREAGECIRRLDARPGWKYDATPTPFVTPDVFVRKRRGVWTAVLNESAMPRLNLNQDYARLFERQACERNPALAGCLERARWTVQNLAQRAATIHDVAQAIVAKQKLFLDYGPLAMKPLTLRAVADAVGVHPSTVSRTVHHKYIATPSGVFELKYFFSRGLAHRSGRATAPTAIKELLRELISSEQDGAPLSDATLARMLGEQGFSVARRTVTKYRQAMNIEPVDWRRR
ncbi:RNA polymerase, sigma 54 subunit, RpoN/SigL [Variovorax sp. HW608]|uniref:RNA polymerase factor sigma-54 n=1 Tax=Variovorax sp. HW608 TaxID=1034889 RepID=UPI0008201C71|nr:RNA polymerase factor sigma-54 [Variovorax sp. HW608]SCK21165.1 RNA polymerase, sigma 54 subunit, RpoN/SigL [Variovorax sp. HW608]